MPYERLFSRNRILTEAYDSRIIPHLTQKTAALHAHGVVLFGQLVHLGREWVLGDWDIPPMAPSPIRSPRDAYVPRAMTQSDNELRLLKVPLHLGVRINRASDLPGTFDAAIVATGAQPNPLPTALAAAGAMRWFDILDQGAPEPKGNGRALFVDDGSGFWWNYGVAEALVEAGWTMLFATPSATIGHQIPHESVGPMLARLGRGSTEYRVLTILDEVTPDGARLMNLTSGEEMLVPCGLIVVQTGRSAVARPTAALIADGVPEVHEIGDCLTPRRVSFAVFEGQRVGRTI